MTANVTKKPKGLVELCFEIDAEEIRNELEAAAGRLNEAKPIDGFRAGKAPYATVAGRFGEMAIYEEALPEIVRKSYVNTVREHALRTFGEPRINVSKLAPGNALAFTAEVALVPNITKLADRRKVKVALKEIKIAETEVDSALKELQRMQTKEALVRRESRAGDKVVVDMTLSRAGVVIDGGQARDHGILLDEEYYVPGMREQVTGVKEGDKKKFFLRFPETHFQKNIAGKDVEFDVTVKGVFELQHPPLDVAFAKNLGQENMAALRELLKKNLAEDSAFKDRQRVELEILEKLVADSSFEEIPDAIVNAEVERMIGELRQGLEERGAGFDDYLRNIKKSLAELKLDFAVQAIKRIKTAILVREIGEKDGVEISDAELLEEVNRRLNSASEDAETQNAIRSEEYQDQLRTVLRNRRVIEHLREAVVGKN